MAAAYPPRPVSLLALKLRGAFWMALYVAVVCAPLAILLPAAGAQTPSAPVAAVFWREFSTALAFTGLSMGLAQFALTARLKRLKAPFGSDVVYFFHKRASLMAGALLAAHPLILFATMPETRALLNVWEAPWRARLALASLVCFGLLLGLAVFRKRLGLEYDGWRRGHAILAVTAVGLALGHMLGVNRYLALPEKRWLWLCYCAFWLGLVVWYRGIKPWRESRRPWRVESVTPERGGAWSLTLAPSGHPGFRHEPGQFVWLTLWASPYSDSEHPFSISSHAPPSVSQSGDAPGDGGRVRLTIKEAGDFTARIKTALPGQTAWVDGPYGAFSVDRVPGAAGFVFIAGGVGITPIMSMLQALQARGDHRPLTLVCCNGRYEDVIFREELERMAGPDGALNLTVRHALTKPHEGWIGAVGRIGPALLEPMLPPPEQRASHEYFVCGPEGMMDAAESALVALGVPLGRVHSERFDLA